MRNTPLTLGLLGGAMAFMAGFLGVGYAPATAAGTTGFGLAGNVPLLIAPVLGICGGILARPLPLWGGGAMLVSALSLLVISGLSVLTLFPLVLLALGGGIALLVARVSSS
jgi:hypothetical protein